MLQIENVSKAFGGVFANKDVSLTIRTGELRGIIGPNGAGKSTLFSLINGTLRSRTGTIVKDGTRIDRLPTHRRAALGIATVFQGERVFSGMSVLENVMVGAHTSYRQGVVGTLFGSPRRTRTEREVRARALRELERVGLGDWAERDCAKLPLGQQRRLQVARALAGRPDVLLLDEPASGLRHSEREDLIELILELHAEGVTVLLVEHDVAMVMRVAETVTVLALGEIIAEGPPDEIIRNHDVITAYLGTAGNGNAHAAS